MENQAIPNQVDVDTLFDKVDSKAACGTRVRKCSTTLECHLNIWLQPLSKTVGKLADHRRSWVEDTKDDPFIPISQTLTHHILDALFANHYEDGGYERAKEFLTAAEKLVDQALVPVENKLAFDYLLKANHAILLYWHDKEKEADALTQVAAVLWKELNQSPKAQAAFMAMKAFCYGIKGDCETRLDIYSQIVELEPNVPEYLDSYYKALRKIRREKSFLSAPPEKEIELVERAYGLAPKSPCILRSMSMIYHDTIKEKNHDYRFTNRLLDSMDMEEFVRKMKFFAKEASETNPNSVVNAIRMAEILSYGPDGKKNSTNDVSECETHFLKCLETWPNNSEVLHKIGKFYCSIDANTGLSYLKKSIEIDGENYPAMMDYLRTCYRQNKDRLSILIDLLDSKIPNFVHRQKWYSSLLCLKASLLAKKHNFEAALGVWKEAIEVNPDVLSNDHTFLGRGTFHGLFLSQDFYLLREHLEDQIERVPIGSNTQKVLQSILCAISPRGKRNGFRGQSDRITAGAENVEPRPNTALDCGEAASVTNEIPTIPDEADSQIQWDNVENLDPVWAAEMEKKLENLALYFNDPDYNPWTNRL